MYELLRVLVNRYNHDLGKVTPGEAKGNLDDKGCYIVP